MAWKASRWHESILIWTARAIHLKQLSYWRAMNALGVVFGVNPQAIRARLYRKVVKLNSMTEVKMSRQKRRKRSR